MSDYHFVLDCSVTMAWCFEDEITDYTEKMLDELSDKTAIVPSIWPLEVINVLLVAVRRKRLTAIKAVAFLERFSDLSIEVAPSRSINSVNSIFQLGLKEKLSGYDAAYLEIAMSRNLPIATLDKALIKAAKSVDVKVMT